jgi:hypothetical protein
LLTGIVTNHTANSTTGGDKKKGKKNKQNKKNKKGKKKK